MRLDRTGPLLFGDIAGDLGGADHRARGITHRRNRERHVDRTMVLADPHGFEMPDPFALTNPPENLVLFRLPVRRDQDAYRLPDELRRAIAEDAFRRRVAGLD